MEEGRTPWKNYRQGNSYWLAQEQLHWTQTLFHAMINPPKAPNEKRQRGRLALPEVREPVEQKSF